MVAATHSSAKRHPETSSTGGSSAGLWASQPPTERDWYLFEAVAVAGLSSRQAAQQFGISQTRVQQIRHQVTEWLAVIHGPGEGLSPIERICAAIDLAERRCNYMYSEAMEAWRASQEPQVSTRIGPTGHEIKTTTLKGGDSRYLWMAMRVNTQALHILGLGKKLLADAFELNVDPNDRSIPTDPRVTGKRAAGTAAVASNPPVGDCSPQAGEQGDAGEDSTQTDVVSAQEPTRSEIREAQRAAVIAAYRREIETVQQQEEADRERARATVAAVLQADERRKAERGGHPHHDESADEDDPENEEESCAEADATEVDSPYNDELTDAEKEAEERVVQMLRQMEPGEAFRTLMTRVSPDASPEAPPAAPRRPLNRKERRARQKLLARKLRKAK
jgi:hypothetical protein